MIAATKPRQPRRPSAPRVVYGPAFWGGDDMLVLPFETPVGWAGYHLARNHATTWAGFLAALPADHRQALDDWSHEAGEYAGFAEYWARRVDEDYEDAITRDQAWADYLELSWPDERPPLGDEPFDADSWAEVEFNCDIGPSNPQSAMTGSVPAPILAKFGKVLPAVWDGDMASLSMDDEQAIVEAYRALGYRIIRHDDLIHAACGETGDPDVLQRLLVYTDFYEDEPPRLADIVPVPVPAPAPAGPVTEITADP